MSLNAYLLTRTTQQQQLDYCHMRIPRILRECTQPGPARQCNTSSIVQSICNLNGMSEPYRDGREGQLCLSTTMISYFIVQTSKRPQFFRRNQILYNILNLNDFIIRVLFSSIFTPFCALQSCSRINGKHNASCIIDRVALKRFRVQIFQGKWAE